MNLIKPVKVLCKPGCIVITVKIKENCLLILDEVVNECKAKECDFWVITFEIEELSSFLMVLL